MLDIRATHYPSPLAEVPFSDVVLTVHLLNVADETGLVTGKFRVYNDNTGSLIHTSEIAPITMIAGQVADVSALTDFDPPAPLDDVYFVIFDGNASNPLVPNGIGIHLGAFTFDVKVGPLGPAPAAHAVTHEEAGADPIETEDLGTAELDTTLTLHPDGGGGLDWAATTPAAHAASHENGGTDEISVAGLSGLLADTQTPTAHGNAAHTSVFEDQANKGVAGGYCGLPNPLNAALPLRGDGATEHPTGLCCSTDLCSPTIAGFAPFAASVILAGTIAAIAGELDHPGIYRLSCPGAVQQGYRVALNLAAFRLSGSHRASVIFRPQTLANSVLRLGFHDGLAAAVPTDGCWIEMSTILGVPGTLYGVASAAGVAGTTATSIVIVTNTWYRAVVELNAAANLVTFTLFSAAGAVLWTDTLAANIPTAAGQETSCQATAFSNGAVAIMDLDYIAAEIRTPLIR